MIDYRITHCDWDVQRRQWLAKLLAVVPQAIVIRDECRSVWETSRRAWLTQGDGSHVFVLQDDILPTEVDFAALVLHTVSGAPEAAHAFFQPMSPIAAEAYHAGRPCGSSAWGGTICVPRRHIVQMIAIGDGLSLGLHRADERIDLALRQLGCAVVFHRPPLLDHIGHDRSLIGNEGSPHRRGRPS